MDSQVEDGQYYWTIGGVYYTEDEYTALLNQWIAEAEAAN